MDNTVLEDIKKYAINRLNSTYGYCGVAEGADTVMLNSDDRNGRDILITIVIEDED